MSIEDIPPVPGKPDTGNTEPAMGMPQDLDHGDNITKVIDVCTLWCKALFSRRPEGAYRFDKDPLLSNILIGGAYTVYPGEVGRTLPRVAVLRSDVRSLGTSHAQISNYGIDDPSRDYQEFLDKLGMSIVFRVVCQTDVEATKIGKFILDSFTVMRTDVQRQTRNADFLTNRMHLSAPTPHGSAIPAAPDPEFKRVDVTVPAQINNTIRVDRTGYYGKVLQTFNVEVDRLVR